METQFTDTAALTLRTTPEWTARYTTLLQTGIQIPVARGTSIGAFLEMLPGFTPEYITDQIQTIFLNGTATDNLETPLDSASPVLAISAAMPGLAGAIFRKNSLHAALRTVKNSDKNTASSGTITVTLKLFNAIARDRGEELLRHGVILKAAGFTQFLVGRSALLSGIMEANLQGMTVPAAELPSALAPYTTIHLIFTT